MKIEFKKIKYESIIEKRNGSCRGCDMYTLETCYGEVQGFKADPCENVVWKRILLSKVLSKL